MKIDFTFETEYGSFGDAIVLPDDHTFSEEEIEAMKQERLNNWITIITTIVQPSAIEPIVEESPMEPIIEEVPIEPIVEEQPQEIIEENI